jgi:hypothetical protein
VDPALSITFCDQSPTFRVEKLPPRSSQPQAYDLTDSSTNITYRAKFATVTIGWADVTRLSLSTPDADAERGRGPRLIDGLLALHGGRWGVAERNAGKTVFVVLPLHGR